MHTTLVTRRLPVLCQLSKLCHVVHVDFIPISAQTDGCPVGKLESMVQYPPQLTSEEKALKKRYAKLYEKNKELKNKTTSPQAKQLASPGKSAVGGLKQIKEAPSPKDARAAAKKLLDAGKLSIATKKTQKTSGFKRVGEGAAKAVVPPPTKKPSSFVSSLTASSSSGTPSQPPVKPKPVIRPSEVKQLYNRFVKSSDDISTQKIPKFVGGTKNESEETATSLGTPQASQGFSTKECTVFIQWKENGIDEEVLRAAFERFGVIQDIKIQHQSEAFVTFQTPGVANTVQREMNKGMIHGTDVFVELASDENGFVELPPEAVDKPWSRIAAGMDVVFTKESQISRKRPKDIRQTVSYKQNF